MWRWIPVVAIATVAPATVSAQADRAIVLTAADAGKLTTIRRHQTVRLRLQANPSTGYSWQVEADRGLRVTETGARPSRPGVPGAPSMAGYDITAPRSGRYTVVFRYVRPWERKAAVRTLTYRFRVR